MRVLFRSAVAFAYCIAVSGCWAPEEFTATLNVDKARNYQFAYDGTIAFAPALGQIKERGQLSQADEAEIRKAGPELQKERGITSATYVGRGRFRVKFRESGSIQSGKKLFFDLVEFRVDPNGRIRVLGADVSPENRQELSGVGLKLHGTLKLTSQLRVVEHNATTTPWFGGLFGAYKWQITLSQVARPSLTIE